MTTTVTFKVDDELFTHFKLAAEGAERTVSQQLRHLMRSFVVAWPAPLPTPVKPKITAQTGQR